MMTSATEVLRRMLDERGVEWWKASPCKTKWHSPVLGGTVAVREWNGKMVLDAGYVNVTPEQAIAATLGAGTCKVESSCAIEFDTLISPDYFEFEMSCGSRFRWSDNEPPDYCPGCGRKVMDE